MPRLFTVSRSARHAGLTPEAVKQAVTEGRLIRSVREDKGRVRFVLREEDIDALKLNLATRGRHRVCKRCDHLIEPGAERCWFCADVEQLPVLPAGVDFDTLDDDEFTRVTTPRAYSAADIVPCGGTRTGRYRGCARCNQEAAAAAAGRAA